MCTGIPSGCEAAVHAMTELFEEPENQGVLLVDAENTFKSSNRKVALHNIYVFLHLLLSKATATGCQVA